MGKFKDRGSESPVKTPKSSFGREPRNTTCPEYAVQVCSRKVSRDTWAQPMPPGAHDPSSSCVSRFSTVSAPHAHQRMSTHSQPRQGKCWATPHVTSSELTEGTQQPGHIFTPSPPAWLKTEPDSHEGNTGRGDRFPTRGLLGHYCSVRQKVHDESL